MVVKITAGIDLGEIDKFSMIPRDARRNAFTLVGDEYMFDVRNNVDSGKTPDGKPLKPYTEEYAGLKRRAGRKVSVPDLNLTGIMWRAMVALVSRDGSVLTVSFPGNHPATWFRSAKGPSRGKGRSAPGQSLTVSRRGGKQIPTSIVAEANDRIRPFIGTSPAGLQRLFRFFVRSVSKAIDKGK